MFCNKIVKVAFDLNFVCIKLNDCNIMYDRIQGLADTHEELKAHLQSLLLQEMWIGSFDAHHCLTAVDSI